MARKKEKDSVWPYIIGGVLIWWLWKSSKPGTTAGGGGGGSATGQAKADARQLANDAIDKTTFVAADTPEEQYRQIQNECK